MAAIDTERGKEFVTLQCEHFLIPEGNLTPLDAGRVGFVDKEGRTGISGLLPESDKRAIDAQRTFGALSAHEIERHNSYMARVSSEAPGQVFWMPDAVPESEAPIGHVDHRNSVDGSWPTWTAPVESSSEVGRDHVYELGDNRSGPRKPRTKNQVVHGHLAYPPSEFFGIMLDSGSSMSVVSEHQLAAYRHSTGFATAVTPVANARLSSMHGSRAIRGIAEFRFPFGDSYRSFHASVSPGDSPLILGLSDHRRLGMSVCSLSNTVTFSSGADAPSNILPLYSQKGHLFLRWTHADEECLFTVPELRRLHRRFGHPSTQKLVDFLQRCDPEQIDPAAKSALEEISASCSQCQHGARRPVRFRVSIPSDMFEFNREVIVDLFTINGRTAISFVDRDTRFAVCRFMESNRDVKAKDIWRMLLVSWVFPYSGYPDALRHDRGTQFVAPELQVAAAEAGISAVSVGIESPNAMGIGERVHGPIRRIFEKLLADNPGFDDQDFLLLAATKSYNDMQGVDGLVPTLLVFGVFPKIPLPGSSSHAIPNHVRLRVIKSSREEYQAIIDEQRLKDALVPNRPTPSLPIGLSHGTRVLVFRDTTERWEPAMFLYESGPLVFVRIGTRVQPFAREKVKVAVFGEDYGDEDGRLNVFDVPANESTTDAAVGLQDNTPVDADAPAFIFEDNVEPTSDLPHVDPDHDSDPRIFYASPTHLSVEEFQSVLEECLATEIIRTTDNRATLFDEAIKLELSGLMEKGVFEEVRVPVQDRRKLNILKSRFVLALKDPGTPTEKKKARLVVQAMPHADRDRPNLFTYSPTVSKASFRLLLSLAASKGFDVHLRDISQAYVCSEFSLIRDAYIVPPKSLGLPSNVLWKLKKPLYGLPESGLLWYETYRIYHEVDLRMQAAAGDPCLYYAHEEHKLSGIIVTQVDDSAIAGTSLFLQRESDAAVAFPSKGRTCINRQGTDFNGSRVARVDHGFSMDQTAYISRITTASSPHTPEAFGTLKGKLHYASSNTRPDHSCAINLLSQTLPKDATAPHFAELDRINAEMHDHELHLLYKPLDLSSVELWVYSDASFANCPDLRSQLGYVIYIRDKHGTCSLLSWASSRSKRVTRSVLAAELFALSHSYDVGFSIRYTCSQLLKRDVPLRLFTDSKTLFQSVTNLTSMTEKRLLIDIASLRDAYRNGDLEHLAHIDTADNPADAMTKPRATSGLVRTLSTCLLRHKINKCVGTGRLPDHK